MRPAPGFRADGRTGAAPPLPAEAARRGGELRRAQGRAARAGPEGSRPRPRRSVQRSLRRATARRSSRGRAQHPARAARRPGDRSLRARSAAPLPLWPRIALRFAPRAGGGPRALLGIRSRRPASARRPRARATLPLRRLQPAARASPRPVPSPHVAAGAPARTHPAAPLLEARGAPRFCSPPARAARRARRTAPRPRLRRRGCAGRGSPRRARPPHPAVPSSRPQPRRRGRVQPFVPNVPSRPSARSSQSLSHVQRALLRSVNRPPPFPKLPSEAWNVGPCVAETPQLDRRRLQGFFTGGGDYSRSKWSGSGAVSSPSGMTHISIVRNQRTARSQQAAP